MRCGSGDLCALVAALRTGCERSRQWQQAAVRQRHDCQLSTLRIGVDEVLCICLLHCVLQPSLPSEAMVKKKVDARIRTLIENGVATKHRTLMLIVGDHGRDQVVNLHYMLSKATVRARPSVLWCYKKDLGFTSHRQKRMRKIKREIARGIKTQEEAAENPFELFVSATDIRYCFYKESHKILGQTFGMCVLQVATHAQAAQQQHLLALAPSLLS